MQICTEYTDYYSSKNNKQFYTETLGVVPFLDNKGQLQSCNEKQKHFGR